MTKKELQDSARKAAAFIELLRQQIDGGFKESDIVEPGDPRLTALHGMCSNPKGALTGFLTALGGPAVPPAKAAPAPPAALGAAPELQAGAAFEFQQLHLDQPAETPKALTDSGDPVKLGFDEFLTSVGQAMLATQRQLDDDSAEYLKGIQGQSHILPSVFRLPKLSGTMKFALEKVDGKKMNLVFFSSGSQESGQHQQEIQFDLVSAPAPIEAVTDLRRAAPRLDLLLDPKERASVFAAIGTTALPKGFTAARAVLQTLEPGLSYLMWYADLGGVNNVGLWRISTGEKPRLETVYDFNTAFAGAEVSLRDLVNAIGEKQEAFLKLLEG